MFNATTTLLILTLISSPIAAGVIYDNGGPDLITPDAVQSDLAPGTFVFPTSEIADDFSLAASNHEIGGVRWWGGYGDANTPVSDSFTVKIYENGNGGPNEGISQTVYTGAASRITTGRTISGDPFAPSGFDIYEYLATFNPAGLIGGQPYWLSIVNNTIDDTDDSWFWFASNGSRGNGNLRGPGNEPFRIHAGLGRGTEFAFQVNGIPDAATVPEPTTLALMTLGLFGMGRSMRKGRAA